ncbi:MAG: ATPase, partial [Gaiellales bacterium]
MSLKPETERGIEEAGRRIRAWLDRIGEVIVGQRPLLERLVLGLLCDGHVLLEGVPGLGKSLMVQTLARSLRADFRRIQFTPDLLPADLTGTRVFHPKTQEFSFKEGPL